MRSIASIVGTLCLISVNSRAADVQYSKAALSDLVDWNALLGGDDVTELHDRQTFAGYVPIKGLTKLCQ